MKFLNQALWRGLNPITPPFVRGWLTVRVIDGPIPQWLGPFFPAMLGLGLGSMPRPLIRCNVCQEYISPRHKGKRCESCQSAASTR